ncbi:microsomal signal peptidase 25 kDa subunit-domain-containing protein [Boletus edulis BED1]|uniref:Signal peptidase complex subunit 2 n=1 Tax=Boletus edulis BED1 TaxID=1328754 RepID=A0AAD4BRN2_BOLED|nr:microsomal signal peptidase 25 kDa subunit-domain-containing protein [Boletus edulis BED1]
MPPKKSAKGRSPEPSAPVSGSRRSSFTSPERPPGPLSIPVSAEERDTIKVNNASATELKNACDDALKRYISRPNLFKQIHLHTDVRLTLGWAGVLVAAATGLYGWKVEFEQSKPAVWAGFIIYVILTSLQALYAYFVEGDIVFVGRRKTFSKRIVTERVTISSRTVPISASSSQSSSANAPFYSLNITYVQSTSGGKSLLAKNRAQGSKEYGAFFDEKGVMVQEVFETWVGELVENAMEGKAT